LIEGRIVRSGDWCWFWQWYGQVKQESDIEVFKHAQDIRIYIYICTTQVSSFVYWLFPLFSCGWLWNSHVKSRLLSQGLVHPIMQRSSHFSNTWTTGAWSWTQSLNKAWRTSIRM
jgi:hypothetical protein